MSLCSDSAAAEGASGRTRSDPEGAAGEQQEAAAGLRPPGGAGERQSSTDGRGASQAAAAGETEKLLLSMFNLTYKYQLVLLISSVSVSPDCRRRVSV